MHVWEYDSYLLSYLFLFIVIWIYKETGSHNVTIGSSDFYKETKVGVPRLQQSRISQRPWTI